MYNHFILGSRRTSQTYHTLFQPMAIARLAALDASITSSILAAGPPATHMHSGWPRSGWPQVGHFDQKIKVNQIASYCAMLYPRCCSLWPCTFGSCIPPTLTPLKVKPDVLILISIGGRTLQCGVMYIFHVFMLPKLTKISNCGIGKSKGL